MVSSQRILLVAAEAREFDGLLPLCTAVRKLQWPAGWARYGEAGGRQYWMVANGAGAQHARPAAESACSECHPEAIVSMGFCGALDPALSIGDIFVATRIVGGAGPWPVADSPTCLSLDRVAQTAAEKAVLRASGASVVEMEAVGVAACAAALGIPFHCVKAVTDTAGQSFTIDFNRALLSSGHFGTIRILASALQKPGKAFPELFRLRNSCRIAARKLGEFIAGYRF